MKSLLAVTQTPLLCYLDWTFNMFKKFIAMVTVIYSTVGYSMEYDESFYITPKLDFVNQLDSDNNSDFGLGYALDIGVPIYKFVSFENTIRYIDWNSASFESNFVQYGALLKLNFPFTDKTHFALSGGLLADLDVGNEARDREVNPYVKLDVYYNINNNLAVVLGFNQSFSSEYLDQYAYSLGVKYKFYKDKSAIEPQVVCDCILTKDEVETIVLPKQEEPEYAIKLDVNSTIDYVLKEGDHIYRICRKFNMSFDQFMNLNKEYFADRDLDYVYPGEIVKVENRNK